MQIDGVRVSLYRHGNGGACIYVGEAERNDGDADRLAELLEKEAGDLEYTLIVFEISDWNSQLSPRPVPVHCGLTVGGITSGIRILREM